MKRNALTLSIGGLLYSIMPSAHAADLAQPISVIGEQPCITDPKTGVCTGGTLPISPIQSPLTAEPSIVVYSEPVEIDLLVAYTRLAMEQAGGTNNVINKIREAVRQANKAYINSGVNQKLCLVSTTETTYQETPSSTQDYSAFEKDLNNLTNNLDHNIDLIHQKKEEKQADLVTLIRAPSEMDKKMYGYSECGIAWLMGSDFAQQVTNSFGRVSPVFESRAYSVVNTDCFDNHSLAHELGHNYGAHHDREHTGGVEGAFPYSHGYQLNDYMYTIMSYPSMAVELDNPTTDPAPERINYFSNPNISFNEMQTGEEGNADNALTLNNTSPVVSAFRDRDRTNGTRCDDVSSNEIELSSDSISTPSTKTITLRNKGITAVNVTSISTREKITWISSITPAKLTIPAGGSATVKIAVNFDNAQIGINKADLQVISSSNSVKQPKESLLLSKENILTIPVTLKKAPKEDKSLPATDSRKYARFDATTGTMDLYVRVSETYAVQTKLSLSGSGFVLESITPARNQPFFNVAEYDYKTQIINVPALSVVDHAGLSYFYKAALGFSPNGTLQILGVQPIKVKAVN